MKISRKLLVLFLLISLVFTFVACNKSIKFNINFISDDETVHIISTSGNETITLPENPTKDGYVFDGWYWDKDIWEKPFTASSLLNVPLQNDMKVYAKWLSYEETIPKYTVTFETNGGTSVKSIVASVIEESPHTQKDYNSFVGWYTDISLQESTKVAFPFTPFSDVTLYAKWTVDFTEGLQMTLQTSTNTYFVTGYTGGDADIVIPSTYKGLEVTGINARAFEGNSTIRTVVIPDSVITVGLGAFSECYNLVSVDMSDQVQLLGASAFSNCIKLETIDLPNTLQNIGGEAFFGCTALKELYLSNDLGNIGTNIIRGCNSLSKLTLPGRITLISLVGDTNDNIPQGLKEIQIAEGSEVVCENMLYNCVQIESLTIASSVKSIKNSAFYGLKNIKEINLNAIALDDLAKGNQAFFYIGQDAEDGTTLTIGNKVTRVPAYLFYPSTDSAQFCNITSIVFEEASICESIGDYAFYNCKSLTNVTIPDSVTSIGSSAFGGCSALENLTIPFVGSSASATSASSSTLFGYIFGTTSYMGGVATEQYCSSNSSSKIKYYIPSSLKTVTITGGSINYGAFYNCSNLTNVIIDGSITSIGGGAFYNCSSLKSATIGDSVTSIGYDAFRNCDSLKEVHTNDIVSWCNISFNGSSANPSYNGASLYLNGELVTDLIIPNTITEIKSYAFYGCGSLTSITIPDSVTSIGNGAFSGCSSLSSITIPFVGATKNGTNYTHFGYIFGASSYSNNSNCVPSRLKKVIITGGASIECGAFYGCTSLSSITIPDSVTSIGNSAFCDCSSIANITIPDSVMFIGDRAFYGCTSLASVTIPDSVTSIGEWTFNSCTSLASITIPDSVTSIGERAFSSCSSLTSVTIGDGVTSIGSHAFYDCTSLTSAKIGASVTSIESSTFSGCTSLTSITIPDDVTSIGDSAFYGCTSLKSIIIPDSVMSIGAFAFSSCYSLTNATIGDGVTIPGSVMSIGSHAFYDCTSLTSVKIGASVTSIESSAFYGCSSLATITIPNSVTSIGSSAFYNCSSLTSITIPDSVTSIGSRAFGGCSNLENLTIPFVGSASTTNFGYIFGTTSYTGGVATEQDHNSNTTAKTTYYVPSSLKEVTVTGGSINYGAFHNCSNLTNVIIGDSVTAIGGYAFYNCSSLTSLTIGDSVTLIGGTWAFGGCESLKEVHISDIASWCNISFVNYSANPLGYGARLYLNGEVVSELIISDDVTKINDYAFYKYSSLTSVTIPDSVTSIGSSAFSGCKSLKEVHISDIASWCNISFNGPSATPLGCGARLYLNSELVSELIISDNITKINDYAFYNCSSLSSITISDSVTSIGSYAFYDCSSLTNITIGESVKSIGEYAFGGCSSLEIMTIPDSVTSIGPSAFSGCSTLENLTIPFVGSSASATSASSSTLFGYIFGTASYTGGIATEQYYSSSSKTTYYIPSSLKKVTVAGGSINYGAFYNCSNLTSITIGDGVTSIGERAFDNCSSLSSVTIGDNVTSIGDVAFYGCKSLQSITIPDSVTFIGRQAFYVCYSLTTVTIGNNVTSIDYGAFMSCTSLTSVTIPDSVTSIGSSVFGGCSNLESLTIPFIGSSASATSASSSTLFGYIFGTASYTGGVATEQKYYTISNSYWYTHYITHYIPSSLKKVMVTGGSINYGAFHNCSNLTNVIIGDGVTSIGGYAFYNCSSLTSITIPNSVTSIGSSAFYNCSSLTSITIPDSVTSIGSSAFSGCSSLTSITIPDSVMSIGSSAFDDCSSLESVKIGNSVMSIGEYAFSDCTLLKEVHTSDIVSWCNISFDNYSANPLGRGARLYLNGEVISELIISDDVTKINDYAFYNCLSLTSITIPDSVTSIGSNAFYNCSSLTSVTIPDSVTSIGPSAFSGCSNLESLIIPFVSANNSSSTPFGYIFGTASYTGGIATEQMCYAPAAAFPYYNRTYYIPSSLKKVTVTGGSINYGAFSNCSNLTSITIGDGVTSIGERAFDGCSSLTSVTIPDSVTSIGDWAFYNCTFLTKINFNAIDSTIDDYAFYNAGISGKGISVTIGKNVTKIPAQLFSSTYSQNSPKITSVVFEEGSTCESIGYFAFHNCSSLTSVTIPDSITSIGESAFSGCSSLTSITIPDSVTSIGSSAFSGCSSLTSITIPDSVMSIGSFAFYDCTSLTSVKIGNSVMSIGSSAFSDCTLLKEVHTSDIVSWCNISFDNYSANPLGRGARLYLNGEVVSELIISDDVTKINDYAFYGCKSLQSITIPDSVTSIGSSAFSGCSSLTIYCEATSQPSGWSLDWNYSNRPVYWYSENKPTTSGNYWHYVNGEVVIWE